MKFDGHSTLPTESEDLNRGRADRRHRPGHDVSTVVSVRLPDEQVHLLRSLAGERGATPSEVVRDILAEYLGVLARAEMVAAGGVGLRTDAGAPIAMLFNPLVVGGPSQPTEEPA